MTIGPAIQHIFDKYKEKILEFSEKLTEKSDIDKLFFEIFPLEISKNEVKWITVILIKKNKANGNFLSWSRKLGLILSTHEIESNNFVEK